MRVWHAYEFSKFFGGHWPMFPLPEPGIGRREWDAEKEREEVVHRRYTVTFVVGERESMLRHFWSQRGMLAYMRRWGLSTTDIKDIYEWDWEYNALVSCWRVVADSAFYGSRRGWYFPTEQAAEAFADELDAGWKVLHIFPVLRRVRFSVPYGNTTRIPYNPR